MKKNKFINCCFIFTSFLIMSTTSFSQEIKSMQYDELSSRILVSNDTLYVLNFWATWCKPCIGELPYFEQSNKDYKSAPVKIILVNLDFNKSMNSVTIPFVQNKKMMSEIIHLTDTDPNKWINKVESTWSGALPATIMYKNQTKLFFKEGPINQDELNTTLNINLAGSKK